MQTVVPHGILLPPEKIRLPDQLSREKELRDELSNLAVLGKYDPSSSRNTKKKKSFTLI